MREGQPLNREPHASPDDHREEEMWAAVLNADASDLGSACDTHAIRISEWRSAMLECTTAWAHTIGVLGKVSQDTGVGSRRRRRGFEIHICLRPHRVSIIPLPSGLRLAAKSQRPLTSEWGQSMTSNTIQTRYTEVAEQLDAQIALALVRLAIGAMFTWVFFENLGKGAYTPAGYARLINYYIQQGRAPAVWKAVMAYMANHASMVAPIQALTEISLGVLLVLGLLMRPVALMACMFLASLWVSEWGTAWIWEPLVPVLASFALSVRRAGRAWGVHAILARRRPSAIWW
jgi:uncharacterized membrane protein YphA (DoxX/SURF4 family)